MTGAGPPSPGERVGRAQTVRGLVEPAQLGPTLPHEHILSDLSCNLHQAPESAGLGPGWMDTPVTPEVRADLVHWPETNRDDVLLDDEPTAIAELGLFRDAGGGTVVDATTIGLGRDPVALRRVSEATGLHISAGAGWYIFRSHGPEIAERSEDDLADQIVREVEEGIDGTGIRAGHIGEIGCEEPTDLELKVLRAAARAQARTGAMLLVHHIWKPGDILTHHRLLDVVEACGGRLDRTVLAHMDRTGVEPALQLSLVQRGASILYDVFGFESSRGSSWRTPVASDPKRIADFARLIAAGHRDRLLASHDVCLKTMLTRYGGAGYAHLLKRVVPGMLQLGLTRDDVDAILVRNPARLLTFVAPSA